MQHFYEFYMKHPKEEEIHSHFITDTARMNKVGRVLLKQINKQRKEAELWPYLREDLEDFRLRKLR